jgi:hypothetical protein
MQNNRSKIKEINEQRLRDRFKELQNGEESGKNPIDDMITGNVALSNDQQVTSQDEPSDGTPNLTSLQDRFGVRKVDKPLKDAQLTARIDRKTLTRFKDIVKMMYYPDKSNINETVTQIIRAFVEEYDKNH